MKWIMAVIVIAFLLSTFLMYEGRGTRRTPTRNPDGTMTDYEVAQINGRSLMRSELEQRLRNYLATYSTRSVTSIDIPAIYRAVLNQAILESQITKEVEEKGIKVSDAEADQAMKNYADTYFPTREAFYQVLANSGLKPEDYKRSLARQIAADRLVRDAIGEVTISEDKAVEFYDTMKDILYSRPEGYMIHMADFNSIEDAEKFRARISGGESWDVIASGDSAGAINITNSPVMLPESALKAGSLSVLDSIDVGAVSPVFDVASGDYAVAMKVSHVESGTTPYDEVSADIRVLLTQQEERTKLAAYEESLMNKAVVVINDNELFASKAEPQNDEQSGDVLPVVNLETETAPAASNDKAEESVTVVEEVEEVEESEDKPAEVDLVLVEVSEDVPAVSKEPEVVSVVEEPESEDEPEEVELVLVEISEDVPAESKEPEAAPAVEEPKSKDVPAAIEAVIETVKEEAKEAVSEDVSSQDKQ